MMDYTFWAFACFAGLCILALFCKVFPNFRGVIDLPPLTEAASSNFEEERSDLIEVINACDKDGEEGKSQLLTKVFICATHSMTNVVYENLSFYEGREVTDEEDWIVKFESLNYLFFNADVWAFSFKQTNEARAAFEDLIWPVVFAFSSKDKSLRALAEDRIESYTRSHQSKSAMNNPAGVFLNHLKILADNGSVNRGIALPIHDAFRRALDWSAIQAAPSFWLLLGCMKSLFSSTGDWTELSVSQMKQALLDGAQSATPFLPKESGKRELAGVR